MVRFHVAPQNQGQIVEYGYCWIDGAVYERRSDASPGGDVTYRVALNPWAGIGARRAAALDAWSPWNEPPPRWLVKSMRPAPAPRDDE